MDKQFLYYSNGKPIAAPQKVFEALVESDNKIRYFEHDLKVDRTVRRGGEMVRLPSREDSLERLIIAAHGHTAVLFTSYRVMEQVFALLQRRGLPYPLFLLARGGLGTIERFRQSGHGVLFASGSMWEGIDLPGDILSLLVMVKLPFAVPDPIGEHQRSLFESATDYKNAVVIPEMLVKLKQGFGRLIRCESWRSWIPASGRAAPIGERRWRHCRIALLHLTLGW